MVLLQAKRVHETISCPEDLLKQFDLFKAFDDVYNEEFSNTILLTGTPEELDLGKSTLASHHVTTVYTSTTVELPSGPYFLYGTEIHQAWRLYEDHLDAFIFGVVPENVLHPERFVDRDLNEKHTESMYNMKFQLIILLDSILWA